MPQAINTVIVGAGQAGLAVSYYLTQRGHAHLLLEQADRPGHVWSSQRWDSFTLVTPNHAFRLPGAEYRGPEPGGFMLRDEVARRLADYAHDNRLPVKYGVRVTAIRPGPHGRFVVESEGESFEAANVVVATGLFQRPRVPQLSQALPGDLLQLHSSEYRNPDQLLPGAVLVVGTGQSGCQIAEELYQSGRQVYLSVGGAPRVPRRYRGRDCFDWLIDLGLLDQTPDKLPNPQARFSASIHVSGRDGGHSLNLHQFACDGVRLLGRLVASRDGRAWLADDLHANLAKADRFEAEFAKRIDSYVEQHGLDAPAERLPELRDGYQVEHVEAIDLCAEDIGSVIWSSGYTFDFSLVQFPVLEPNGYPATRRGVTDVPGLYFIGLPWLHAAKSGLLLGVGADAEHIAGRICGG